MIKIIKFLDGLFDEFEQAARRVVAILATWLGDIRVSARVGFWQALNVLREVKIKILCVVRRVVAPLNKRQYLRYVGYFVLTLTVILPMTLANAADSSAPTGAETATANQPLVSLNAEVVSIATPTVSIQVDSTSPYLQQMAAEQAAQAAQQKAAEEIAAKAAQAAAQTTQASATVSPDPGEAAKLALAQQAAASVGIDWKVLAAVWQVESGQQWQTAEQNPSGATGPCQFLPSTWRHYATDGNGDGIASIDQAQDCLYGAAKLLASNGAASGDNTHALLAYNHSMAYVDKVMKIASSYAG